MLFWKLSEKRFREAVREEVSISLKNHLEKAIEHGVINALKCFGVTADNQHEVQRDFHYLCKLRKRSEESGHMLIRAIISVSIGATAVAVWEGIKIIVQN